MLAAALNTPVSVMATASEGGAWGMALLAAYRVNRRADEKLDEYLDNRGSPSSAKSKSKIAQPEAEDVEGFASLCEAVRAGAGGKVKRRLWRG